jgi:hypothetical protein
MRAWKVIGPIVNKLRAVFRIRRFAKSVHINTMKMIRTRLFANIINILHTSNTTGIYEQSIIGFIPYTFLGTTNPIFIIIVIIAIGTILPANIRTVNIQHTPIPTTRI